MMLGKIAMKTESKINNVECAINNMTAGIHRKTEPRYRVVAQLVEPEGCGFDP